MRYHVFISYSHKDRKYAVTLLELLKQQKGLGRPHVVPDAAIPLVLGAGVPHSPGKCDLVLMGCEAIITERDDDIRAGRAQVADNLGCLAIAQMARQAGVPLWVLTEASKAGGDPNISCWIRHRADELPAVPVSAFHHETGASEATRDSAVAYPRSEVVPADLVGAIVTERADRCYRRPTGQQEASS